MAIKKIDYNYFKEKYNATFPDEVISEGDETDQELHFLGQIGEDVQNNNLEATSGNNLHNLIGDNLYSLGMRHGYQPLGGYKSKVRVSIDKIESTVVGEDFNIIYNGVSYPSVCYDQKESDDILLLDIETLDPVELIFLDTLTFEYQGNLNVTNIQPISLLYSGKAKEGEISYRDSIYTNAITPNQFKFIRGYENTFNEPAPEINFLPEGQYNLFYPQGSIPIDKLLYLYLSLNSIVPTRSDLTNNFFEQEITLNSGISFIFGYNIYGEVNLQLLVYLKAGVSDEEKQRITEILKAYSYTPTVEVPIYSSDIVNSLESIGITSISNITFLYNGLTNLQLSYQDKKIFKIDQTTPVIFQE